jgi:hypothetical protein
MEGQRREVEVDGQTMAVDATKTFGAISQEIRNQLAPDRVVTEIFLDGRAIDIVEEEDMNAKAVRDLGQLMVKSRQVNELFRESLQMAPRICEALALDCGDIQGFIQNQKIQDAKDRVGEMTSLLEWLLQLISGMETLGSETIETLTFSHGRVMDAVNRMQFLLAKLHLDLSSEKWSDFSATISGDFLKEVSIWKTLFTDISTTWQPRTDSRPN